MHTEKDVYVNHDGDPSQLFLRKEHSKTVIERQARFFH